MSSDQSEEIPSGDGHQPSVSAPEDPSRVPEGLSVDRISDFLAADEIGIALLLLIHRMERELGFVIKERHGLEHDDFLDTWKEASFDKFVKLCITLDYIDHKETLELLGRYRSHYIHNQQYVRQFLDDEESRESMKEVIRTGLEIVEEFETQREED